MKKLYLASTSPRRRALLERFKLNFEIISPRFEETETDLSPDKEALYLAEQKARSVLDLCPNSRIIASDTLIDLEEKKIGKPKDKKDAERILSQLAGKTHRVLTAVVLLDTQTQELKSHLEISRVTFRSMTTQEVLDYIATGEPLDKAGAYAVQGIGRKFITKIEGDEDSIVGLPLKILEGWLRPYDNAALGT